MQHQIKKHVEEKDKLFSSSYFQSWIEGVDATKETLLIGFCQEHEWYFE